MGKWDYDFLGNSKDPNNTPNRISIEDDTHRDSIISLVIGIVTLSIGILFLIFFLLGTFTYLKNPDIDNIPYNLLWPRIASGIFAIIPLGGVWFAFLGEKKKRTINLIINFSAFVVFMFMIIFGHSYFPF